MPDSRSAAPLEYASPDPGGRTAVKAVWVVRILSFVALLLCGYLIYVSVSSSAPAGCGGTSDCTELLTGNRSKWFDLPVSVPAAVVYLAIFVAALAANPNAVPARQRRSWEIMTALTILAGGAAVWFVALQLGVQRFCYFCLAVHACGILILAAVVIGFRNLPTGRTDSSYRIVAGVRPAKVWPLLSMGFGGLAVLLTGQLLSSKPATVISFGGDGPPTTRKVFGRVRELPASTSTMPTTAATNPAVPQFGRYTFSVGDDFVDLDPAELPIYGSPDAKAVIAVMSDYTCPHCRDTHAMWKRIVAAFGDQLVIVILPLPMDSNHNPRIAVTPKASTHSYELAKIAMAVWRADHDAFYKIDDWLYQVQARQPTPDSVRKFATNGLIGADALKKAEEDPWVEKQLKRNIKIYALDGGGMIPKVLLTKPIKGQIRNELEMISKLEQELDIRRVPATRPVRRDPP